MTQRPCLIRRETAMPTGALARAVDYGSVPPPTTGTIAWTRRLAFAEKSPALLLLVPRQPVYNP